MSEAMELIPAATVLLLRSGESGVEVLMVRRNSTIAFGGMWVFPGGRVDDGDQSGTVPQSVDGAEPIDFVGLTESVIELGQQARRVVGVSRMAAVREVEEETGLHVDPVSLVPWSFWVPPHADVMSRRGPRRRFATWFFAAEAPRGDVAIDFGEIHDDEWLTPAGALTKHHSGEIELAPPTWITLWQLSRHDSVGSALSWARTSKPRFFQTRPLRRKPLMLAWGGDAGYELDPDHVDVVNLDGPRNRLTMGPDGWVYEFTARVTDA
jgi:8-oxo-dGTP pyrophosphatase MutT (NUDIX family)